MLNSSVKGNNEFFLHQLSLSNTLAVESKDASAAASLHLLRPNVHFAASTDLSFPLSKPVVNASAVLAKKGWILGAETLLDTGRVNVSWFFPMHLISARSMSVWCRRCPSNVVVVWIIRWRVTVWSVKGCFGGRPSTLKNQYIDKMFLAQAPIYETISNPSYTNLQPISKYKSTEQTKGKSDWSPHVVSWHKESADSFSSSQT